MLNKSLYLEFKKYVRWTIMTEMYFNSVFDLSKNKRVEKMTRVLFLERFPVTESKICFERKLIKIYLRLKFEAASLKRAENCDFRKKESVKKWTVTY